jgi:hypothetical protein
VVRRGNGIAEKKQRGTGFLRLSLGRELSIALARMFAEVERLTPLAPIRRWHASPTIARAHIVSPPAASK